MEGKYIMKDSELYSAFHGTNPRVRRVKYTPPVPPLIKIGRLVRIEYLPEAPSKRKGTRYSHELGDTGVRVLRSNCILCTDSRGRSLFIVKDKGGSRPFFSDRGLIG